MHAICIGGEEPQRSEVVGSSGTELEAAASHPVWALGAEFGSSARLSLRVHIAVGVWF